MEYQKSWCMTDLKPKYIYMVMKYVDYIIETVS